MTMLRTPMVAAEPRAWMSALWVSSPVVLLVNLATAFSVALFFALTAHGLELAAIVLAPVTLGGVLGVGLVAAVRIIEDGGCSVVTLSRVAGVGFRAGVLLSLLPAAVLLLAVITAKTSSGGALLVIPVLTDLALLSLAVAALPVAILNRAISQTSCRRAWAEAALRVGRTPLHALEAVAVVVLSVLLLRWVGSSLLLVVPMPLLTYLAAIWRRI
jgi:hypothetical protein